MNIYEATICLKHNDLITDLLFTIAYNYIEAEKIFDDSIDEIRRTSGEEYSLKTIKKINSLRFQPFSGRTFSGISYE